MAENTKIEWCDHTFNAWTGCTKVGPGCDNCYAEGWSKRAGPKVGKWGPGAPRVRTTPANWRLPLKWNAQAAAEGRRFRVFCSSLADVFDNEVPQLWRTALFALIHDTPNLDWLLLTKRIGNAARMLKEDPPEGINMAALTNLWLGATVVNQAEADRDIPKLLAVPARVRFLSIEPMLGPIDLQRIEVMHGDAEIYPLTGTTECVDDEGEPIDEIPALDWIICGGESGPNARPMHPDWARSLRDQCQAAGVPFLWKQWGEWAPSSSDPARYPAGIAPDGSIVGPDDQFTEDCALMYRVGKKAAGRLLDGVEHNGFPEVAHG